MKILYLLPAVSHPTMRGELRHYYFLLELAQRHEVTVVALTRTPVTPEAFSELNAVAKRFVVTEADPASGVWACHRRLAKRRQVHQAMARMRGEIRGLVDSESFDIALVYGVDLQPIVTELRGLPIVADICDAQSMRIRQSLPFVPPAERVWQMASLWRTRRAERALTSRAHHVTFISERDRAAVPVEAGRARVVANGVDAAYWTRSAPHVQAHHLVFTGVMDYGPNADAGLYLAREILPRVRSVVPGVTLTIAGRNPSAELRRAAASIGAVEVTGHVPDLRPYLEQASVFAAPLRFASGTQNKILESMAMELPVVTSAVAAAGLRVPGAEAPPIQVADEPDAFATAVINLLLETGRRRELAAFGRAYVRRHFDWERSAAQLEACCQAAATGIPAREEEGHARRLAAHP